MAAGMDRRVRPRNELEKNDDELHPPAHIAGLATVARLSPSHLPERLGDYKHAQREPLNSSVPSPPPALVSASRVVVRASGAEAQCQFAEGLRECEGM